jgi:solute carrier family 20 (sodium-dependent phosphate transporter)
LIDIWIIYIHTPIRLMADISIRRHLDILISIFVSSFGAGIWMGANDGANSYGSSTGSKVLTRRQAKKLAIFSETFGAVVLGSYVTETIRKKIVNVSAFEDEPYLLMFGMLCASISSGVWVMIATRFGLAVSTTHAIVGGIVGFALAYDTNSVNQEKVEGILLSWVISPFVSMFITMAISVLNIVIVLNRKDPVRWGKIWMPFLVTIIVIMISLFAIYKGTPQLELDDLDFATAMWISTIIGVSAGVGTFFGIRYKLAERMKKSKGNNNTEDDNEEVAGEGEIYTSTETNIDDIQPKATEIDLDTIDTNAEDVEEGKVYRFKSNKFGNMIEYDEDTEAMFSWLQVFTAVTGSIGHGANDTPNFVGPLSVAAAIYLNSDLSKTSGVEVWHLAYGAVAMCTGIIIYGDKMMIVMGEKLSGITPSRGVAIEAGTATTVLIASRQRWPVSSTHCQLGSTLGSGLIDCYRIGGIMGTLKALWRNELPNLDLKIFGKMIIAMLVTLPASGGLSALLFVSFRSFVG